MKTLLSVVSICILLLTGSCRKQKNELMPRTIESFKAHLTVDMNFNDITKQFGNANADIGSGIHIYIYQLTDGTEVRIGYADKIIYARHVNKDGTIISSIIN